MTRRPFTLWAISIGALAAAVLLRIGLDPILGDTLPFVTMFGAVAAAVWAGGNGPAIVVTLLGYVACHFLFYAPRGHLHFDLPVMVGLVAYLFTCSLIIWIGAAMRTAQRRASERQEVLRLTLNSIGDAVITTDLEGRITDLNPVAESLTGWTRPEAVGQPLDVVFRIVNEQTRLPAANPALRSLEQGTIVGLANHTVLIRKDGSERAIDDSAAPIRGDQNRVSGSVLVFRDVSERRRVEQERANQLLTARRLAAIVESSDDAIIAKSLDGVIQSWNAGAEQIFGYTAAQAVGRHISLIIPEDRLDEEDRIVASLKAGRRVDHYETERLRADGTRLLVSLTISPIKDEEGDVVGASKIARDVTEERRAIDRERELLTDLRRLADDLSEADRRKDEFLAMLAHELRNPLATINNAVGILRIGGDAAESQEAASTMLARQIAHMTRLVDDLLDVSRISRGSIELRTQRTELEPIVEHAVESTRAFCSSLDHQLTVVMPSQPILVDADPTRLAQVLGNLLNNACKFTNRGGHIILSVERENERVAIHVRDDGIGVAPEHLPRLFDMFTQLDTSLERSRDGLGIGLTLVKTLAELHGGTVEAKSGGPGRGSEFVVRLPIVREAATKALEPELEPPEQSAKPHRILIVDDNDDAATSLAMLLALQGHETHTANDGPAGLEAAERLRPDTVLLDIGLPGMNGREVCRRMRQQPWGRNILVVALTGWGQQSDRQASAEAGFDAHLVKPVDAETLGKLLSTPHSPAGAPTR